MFKHESAHFLKPILDVLLV